MKTLIAAALMLGFYFLIACGPSAQEQQAAAEKEKARRDSLERVKTDSITRAVEFKIQGEQAIKDSLALVEKKAKELEQKRKVLVQHFQTEILDAKSELRIANEKMAQLKKPSLLEIGNSKTSEIANQNRVIQDLEDKIRIAQSNLDKLNNGTLNLSDYDYLFKNSASQ